VAWRSSRRTWGCRPVTDGEYRRTYFHIDFLEQLEGVTTSGGIAVSFQSNDGTIDFAPPVMKVTGKVRHVKPIQRADFEFLESVTTAQPKVTIPSPTMLHFRGGRGRDQPGRLP
jgi:5-methyltetrahydropteroyltriglutamate--homocysteine methyltransferase